MCGGPRAGSRSVGERGRGAPGPEPLRVGSVVATRADLGPVALGWCGVGVSSSSFSSFGAVATVLGMDAGLGVVGRRCGSRLHVDESWESKPQQVSSLSSDGGIS
ncbi:hypothetical protein U9M48_041138 [Paspalum notatum var. saurae]|uniref:Uncharacterized protein n=1 Tax=Paspalum notatum var. saurae TaxID=547442 RepID=A0AAQ3XEY3_PASNO